MEFIRAQKYNPQIDVATPAVIKKGVEIGATFYRDDTNQDWYLCQKDWDPEKYKILVDENSRVVCVAEEIDSISPQQGHSVYEVPELPDQLQGSSGDWFFIDGAFAHKDDLKSLSDWKQEYLDRISAFATQARNKIIENADPLKVTAYKDKADRARRVLKGDATTEDFEIIQAEINSRGESETVESLAEKQVQKAKSVAIFSSVIDGWEARASNQVETFEGEISSLHDQVSVLFDQVDQDQNEVKAF